MAEWTPTPEMVEVGVQAVWEATMRTTVMYQTHRSERAREVRAALTAAYPLIAAHVLRETAVTYPLPTRDMVSRGSIRQWLNDRADEIKEGDR